MALVTNTIIDVRSGGSDTLNGGLFDPSQSAGMFADGAATVANTSAPVFTSASYNFVAGDVGAWIYISSGTNWTPGWYQITSVASNAATLVGTIGSAVLATTILPSTVVGCATVASPTAATWTMDYSQQNPAQFAYTDLVSVGAGLTVSSVAKPFAKQQVGNSIVITGGTNFTTGRYVIASVAASVATVVGAANITTGAGAAGTGGQGGGLATPGQGGAHIGTIGMTMLIKAATYLTTTTTNNVAAGTLSLSATSPATSVTKIIGYNSVRGDLGTKPVYRCHTSSETLITTAAGSILDNLDLDGNSQTTSRGHSGVGRLFRMKLRNFTNTASNQTGGSMYLCEITGCSTANCVVMGGAAMAYGCVAHDNTISAFLLTSVGAYLVRCYAVNNTGGSSSGFVSSVTSPCQFVSCTAYGNGLHGFNFSSVASIIYVINCAAVNNGASGTGWGYNNSGGSYAKTLSCAAYGNASGATTGFVDNEAFVTLTGDPFTNVAGNDFSLNNTAGAGASLRSLAAPTAFPGLSTNNYDDIGAVRHADSTSSLVFSGMNGGF